jgi:hypothetical protein
MFISGGSVEVAVGNSVLAGATVFVAPGVFVYGIGVDVVVGIGELVGATVLVDAGRVEVDVGNGVIGAGVFVGNAVFSGWMISAVSVG